MEPPGTISIITTEERECFQERGVTIGAARFFVAVDE
jgi:hypothetical protein